MPLKPLIEALAAGAAVIAVNDRLARRLREAYGEHCRAAGSQSWETPAVATFGGWLQGLYAAQRDAALAGMLAPAVELLSPAQAEAVWAWLIDASPESANLLQPLATARAAAEAWRLCRAWRVPLAALAAGGEDSAAFAGWAESYQHRCAERGWIDSADLADWLAGQPDDADALPGRIVFAGFDEWTPQQRDFIDHLEWLGVDVVRDGLEPGVAGETRAVAAADAEAELQAAARWAAALLYREPDVRIGIVIPDLAARRETALRVISAALDPAALWLAPDERPLPVNVSLGEALAASPVVHDALLALQCTGPTVPFDRLSALLRSPFIGGAEAERTARARLDMRLREHGEAKLAATTLHRFAQAADCPLWQSHWQRFCRKIDAAARVADARAWAEIISNALAVLGWPGEQAPDSATYQAVTAFRDLLAEFARLAPVTAPMRFNEAAGWLARLAGERLFQPQAVAAPVQVLGVLEAAALDFDHLWLAGFDDRRWPARPEPNPFIPPAVQREYGLPHCSAERELDFAEAITRRLLGAAPEVVVSWPEREGDVALRPSPLLKMGTGDQGAGTRESATVFTPFAGAAGKGGAPQARGDSSREGDGEESRSISPFAAARPRGRDETAGCDWRKAIHASARLETLVDDRAPALADGTAVGGGTGLLKDQAACPFQAFARRRLFARAPAAPAIGLDAAVRGQLCHRALERFWEAAGSQAAVAAMAPAERAEAVRVAVNDAVASVAARRPTAFSRRLRELECLRLARLLDDWLEYELARAPFTVVGRELPVELQLGGLALSFRIDRIDAVAGGEAVVDYKTGRIGGGCWDGERPDEPQLPAYALARGDVSAVLFASLKRGALGFRGVAADATLAAGVGPLARGKGREAVSDVPARVAEWRSVLTALAEAFRAGDAGVDPKTPQTCRYCDLGALCRVAEAVEAQDDD